MDAIETAIEAIRAGGIIVVSDNEDRENEGDFVMAAEAATPEKVGFINRYSSGIICAPLTEARRHALRLPMMVARNTDPKHTAFTVSVDYRHGTTTGISAADRAATLTALTRDTSVSGDFTRPGHVFPLLARTGGVLERDGHTEAAVDFARLAGCSATGAICEVVNDNGSMARQPELAALSRAHKLPFVTIENLIAYRLRNEILVRQTTDSRVSNRHGEWVLREFCDDTTHSGIQVYSQGRIGTGSPLTVLPTCPGRSRSPLCECHCESALSSAIYEIKRAGHGCIIFLPRYGHVTPAGTFPDHPGRQLKDAAVVAQILKAISGGACRFENTDASFSRQIAQFGIEMIVPKTRNDGEATARNVYYLPPSKRDDAHAWRLIG